MNRTRVVLALAAGLALVSSQALKADVRSDERTKFQLAGALGKVVNFFGGKAARDGVTSTVAVKGNRMIRTNDTTGEIVDLSEEKVYALDMKKKEYKVKTFAELRREMEEAQKKAAEDARKAQKDAKDEPAQQDPNAKQMEVDFEVKNTGEKKDINGFNTSQAIMTITVREKGKTLQQSGGMVLTSDIWLTPSIPQMKEVADFQMKYFEKLYGPMMSGASPQEMASAIALYPMMKPALEKMATEGRKLQGTPILTTTTIDAVKSAEQMASEQKGSADNGGGKTTESAPPTSVGGLLGGFGRRMAQRKGNDDNAAAAGPKDRATILTTSSEVLKVATTVSAEEVAIPTGFKEKK
ncbi:MAG: hypothetical protein JSU08_18775 [Acidobacteria bacterium]|nr:hypothetical protein [Acidobacteriota bacterium]